MGVTSVADNTIPDNTKRMMFMYTMLRNLCCQMLGREKIVALVKISMLNM